MTFNRLYFISRKIDFHNMAKRKKGICRSRVCVVLFLLILAGASLFNIMSVLQATSRISSVEKEPVEYDVLFHRQSSKSVLPPVYRTKEKTVLSKAGKLLGKYYLNSIRFTF